MVELLKTRLPNMLMMLAFYGLLFIISAAAEDIGLVHSRPNSFLLIGFVLLQLLAPPMFMIRPTER